MKIEVLVLFLLNCWC